jgi:hypothetical protein
MPLIGYSFLPSGSRLCLAIEHSDHLLSFWLSVTYAHGRHYQTRTTNNWQCGASG